MNVQAGPRKLSDFSLTCRNGCAPPLYIQTPMPLMLNVLIEVNCKISGMWFFSFMGGGVVVPLFRGK